MIADELEMMREALGVPDDLPYRTREEWAVCDAVINDPELAENLPQENIHLENLVPTQDLAHTGDDPRDPDEPLFVLRINGINYVVDGHHRLNFHKKHGTVTIEAFVLNGGSEPLTVRTAAKQLRVGRRVLMQSIHPETLKELGLDDA